MPLWNILHIWKLPRAPWTSDFEASSEDLNASLDDKVYFAGETYNVIGIWPNDGFYIFRGSVQSAILPGYEVVDRILE